LRASERLLGGRRVSAPLELATTRGMMHVARAKCSTGKNGVLISFGEAVSRSSQLN
jgi:hypothetical protein